MNASCTVNAAKTACLEKKLNCSNYSLADCGYAVLDANCEI